MAKRAARRFERRYCRLILSSIIADVSFLNNALLAWRASYRSYRALLEPSDNRIGPPDSTLTVHLLLIFGIRLTV